MFGLPEETEQIIILALILILGSLVLASIFLWSSFTKKIDANETQSSSSWPDDPNWIETFNEETSYKLKDCDYDY